MVSEAALNGNEQLQADAEARFSEVAMIRSDPDEGSVMRRADPDEGSVMHRVDEDEGSIMHRSNTVGSLM